MFQIDIVGQPFLSVAYNCTPLKFLAAASCKDLRLAVKMSFDETSFDELSLSFVWVLLVLVLLLPTPLSASSLNFSTSYTSK